MKLDSQPFHSRTNITADEQLLSDYDANIARATRTTSIYKADEALMLSTTGLTDANTPCATVASHCGLSLSGQTSFGQFYLPKEKEQRQLTASSTVPAQNDSLKVPRLRAMYDCSMKKEKTQGTQNPLSKLLR